MTIAFNEFMRQYKMTGSEKADGYSRDAFIGLTQQEKEEVFRLLVTELPFSVEWLFFVDEKKALDVVKKEEEKFRGNGYKHIYILQEHLVRHTEDRSYQNHMIEDYSSYADYLRPLVVDALGRTPMNNTVINFLKGIILTETNTDAVDSAARELLAGLNVPRTSEADKNNYKRLVNELSSENSKIKMWALRKVSKYEANLLIGG